LSFMSGDGLNEIGHSEEVAQLEEQHTLLEREIARCKAGLKSNANEQWHGFRGKAMAHTDSLLEAGSLQGSPLIVRMKRAVGVFLQRIDYEQQVIEVGNFEAFLRALDGIGDALNGMLTEIDKDLSSFGDFLKDFVKGNKIESCRRYDEVQRFLPLYIGSEDHIPSDFRVYNARKTRVENLQSVLRKISNRLGRVSRDIGNYLSSCLEQEEEIGKLESEHGEIETRLLEIYENVSRATGAYRVVSDEGDDGVSSGVEVAAADSRDRVVESVLHPQAEGSVTAIEPELGGVDSTLGTVEAVIYLMRKAVEDYSRSVEERRVKELEELASGLVNRRDQLAVGLRVAREARSALNDSIAEYRKGVEQRVQQDITIGKSEQDSAHRRLMEELSERLSAVEGRKAVVLAELESLKRVDFAVQIVKLGDEVQKCRGSIEGLRGKIQVLEV
jgi:hypothetical protein